MVLTDPASTNICSFWGRDTAKIAAESVMLSRSSSFYHSSPRKFLLYYTSLFSFGTARNVVPIGFNTWKKNLAHMSNKKSFQLCKEIDDSLWI